MKTKSEKLKNFKNGINPFTNQELSKLKGGKTPAKSAEDTYNGGELEEIICTPDPTT